MARKRLCKHCYDELCKGGTPCMERNRQQLKKLKENFIKNWQNYLPGQQARIAHALGLVEVGSGKFSS